MGIKTRFTDFINEYYIGFPYIGALRRQDHEMLAASISTKIGKEIMKQGFNRVDRKRDSTYFINSYQNGLNHFIHTQVHFSEAGGIQIFFKIENGGKNTQTDIIRINQDYSNLFNRIVSNLEKEKDVGEWNHLKVGDFKIVYYIDKI